MRGPSLSRKLVHRGIMCCLQPARPVDDALLSPERDRQVRKTLGYAVLLFVAFCVAACVNETSVFHRMDGKQIGACSGAGFGIIRGSMAISQYHNCREAYLKEGYIEGPPPQ